LPEYGESVVPGATRVREVKGMLFGLPRKLGR
jgi:hypothetical protein